MNLEEAVELLRVVSAIPLRKSVKNPEIRIVHVIGEVMSEGYTLRIEKSTADSDYRSCLNRIAESCNLRIRESKRYLIMYGNPA